MKFKGLLLLFRAIGAYNSYVIHDFNVDVSHMLVYSMLLVRGCRLAFILILHSNSSESCDTADNETLATGFLTGNDCLSLTTRDPNRVFRYRKEGTSRQVCLLAGLHSSVSSRLIRPLCDADRFVMVLF